MYRVELEVEDTGGTEVVLSTEEKEGGRRRE